MVKQMVRSIHQAICGITARKWMLCAAALGFFARTGYSQEFIWAQPVSGSSYEYGIDADLDSQGNLFIIGYGSGSSLVYDTTTYSVNGDGDAFVAKLDSNHQLLWFRPLGGNDNNYHDQGLDIHVDANDNVIVLVKSAGSNFTYNGNTLSDINSSGQYSGEGVIIKIDNNGNYLWHDDGSVSSSFQNVTTDSVGNVYLTGWFSSSLTLGDSVQMTNSTSGTTRDMFVAKYSPTGEVLWARHAGGTIHNSFAYGHNIALDEASGQLVIVGRFTNTIYFDSGSIATSVPYASFLASYDTGGIELWRMPLFNNSYSYCQGLDISPEGLVGVAGFNSLASNPDGLVGFYDLDGNVQSEETYLSTNYCRLNSLAFNDLNECFIAGLFWDTLTIGNNSYSIDVVSSTSNYEGVVFKLTPAHIPVWAIHRQASGENNVMCKDNHIVYSCRIDNPFVYNYGADTVSNNSGDALFAEILDTTCSFDVATDTHIVCDSYTWIDGNTYTASNYSAADTLTNASGCDSIVTLRLTVNSNTGTDVITACDSYQWIDGNTYTASDSTATDTLTNAAGCDSVVTLNLTILPSVAATDTVTACDSFQWIDGNTYTMSNYTATDTLTNAAGCDSVVTLHLTIHYSSTETDTITACDSYQWIDGNTYTASNNTATHTLTNASGCDSVIALSLTIDYSSTSTDVITACGSHQWIDGNTYTASNNTATHTLTNAAGCDSVVTLNLTVNNTSVGTDSVTACHSFQWIDGNTYTVSNDTATHTLTNTAGCDSVVTLNLNIESVSDITTSLSGVTITANNANATSYQWLDCDSANTAITNETAISFTAIQNGSYAVELTENGCVDTSNCILITVVGLGSVEPVFTVMAYPNPTDETVYIHFDQLLQAVELTVTNSRGQIVSQSTLRSVSETQVKLGEAAGTYYLSIETEAGQQIISLIKE